MLWAQRSNKAPIAQPPSAKHTVQSKPKPAIRKLPEHVAWKKKGNSFHYIQI